MFKRPWILHPDQWDAEHVVADLDAIRKYNPQRFEMEQLTEICNRVEVLWPAR